jgi:hypothetical protein
MLSSTTTCCNEQVAALFAEHDDLLEEFTFFLPDSKAPHRAAMERQRQLAEQRHALEQSTRRRAHLHEGLLAQEVCQAVLLSLFFFVNVDVIVALVAITPQQPLWFGRTVVVGHEIRQTAVREACDRHTTAPITVSASRCAVLVQYSTTCANSCGHVQYHEDDSTVVMTVGESAVWVQQGVFVGREAIQQSLRPAASAV